jgi:uncharacterized protein (TIGR03437 family)
MKQFLCAALVTATASFALAQVTINPLPTREFGQSTLFNPVESNAPNLVEGRELFSPSGIAFDASVTPPHVYVVDTANNRVLGWSNANSVSQGNFADLVIGQTDMFSTSFGGPGTNLSTGLISPTGIAVDSSGNVYIADSGNNRILRFKTPYQQQAGNLIVDLVIGQKTSSSGNLPNQGLQNPSANSLFLSIVAAAGQPPLPAGLAVDVHGNLWVADVGNNRVLGFPPASLAANTQLPAASVVLGQTSFTSNALPTQFPPNTNPQLDLAFLENPTGIALDSQGNLYVADGDARVIQYLAPLAIGETGSKVLGVPPTSTNGQVPTYPTASTLGALNAAGTGPTGSPQCVFVASGVVFVCDSPQNRVVLYSSLTVPTSANSPLQSGVTGQQSATAGQANQGQLNPSNATLSNPVAGAIRPDNGEMWIVDQGNNRVVAFANQGGNVYSTASRVLGQLDFIYGTANLIVGSEIWISNYGGGVAVDSNSSPPHLYIADTLNNRILCFNNAYNVGVDSLNTLTQKADLVIGQTDLLHSTVNYPNGAQGQPSAVGLYRPVGVAVDSNGNLWVADSFNGRAVRFPAPFAQPSGSMPTANLVLGQPDFTTSNLNVNQFTMDQPFGIAIFSDGGAPGSGSLAVSDFLTNRILVFTRPSGGDFTNGQQAAYVVGQPTFSQSGTGGTSSQLNNPRHIAVDSSDRLYVCDSGNNRLLVFSKPTGSGPSATFDSAGQGSQVSLSAPQGVIVSFLTGRSWVTSANSSVLTQLPEFETLQSTDAPTQTISTSPLGTLAVALDPFDNLIVADSANRITFYFGEFFYRNTANYSAGVGIGSNADPTPGMLVEIGRLGSAFSLTPSFTGADVNTAPPWPLVENNVQVTVNGISAPIFRMETYAIFFEVPNEAPQSGPADFVVSNPTTGQILAAATFNMQSASPGLYTTNGSGTGQVAAAVYDSKGNYLGNNSPSIPTTAGGTITLWLTGAGYVAGLPADGTAPGGTFNTHATPNVLINGTVAQVLFSGISPQFPGLWQLNVVVPANTPSSSLSPGGITSVVVSLDDYNSNIGGTSLPSGAPGPDEPLLVSNGLITTIYVK